jgi:hypothetical protein
MMLATTPLPARRRPLSFAIGTGPACLPAQPNQTAIGDLLDLSPFAQRIGLALPVLITRAAWFDSCAWTPADGHQQIPQDVALRIRGLLESLITAARGARGNIIDFPHQRIPRDGVSRRPETTTLVAERVGRDHVQIVIALVRELIAV